MRMIARAMSPASITNRSVCRPPLGIIASLLPHHIKLFHIKQDAQKGQTSHPPNPGGYFTLPP
jgi:hypothetical protein